MTDTLKTTEIPWDLEKEQDNFIKVIGVGGGGGNAVNHMYKQGIKDVSFIVCNTDDQDLKRSPIPNKLQIGREITKGLGAGANPEIGRQAAEESEEDIKLLFDDTTKMVFITAGMGGGTGTGAAPVIARIAKERGMLTVGIVTIPFRFEMKRKINKAFAGVEEMRKNVDALLIINNNRLIDIYPDFQLNNAFEKADNILCDAAKGIAEIITVGGYINVDFADVNTIMKDSDVAIMNTGMSQGESRITKAIQNALNSPLLKNSDIKGAQRVLLNIYTSRSEQITMAETIEIETFFASIGEEIEVIFGATIDEDLEESIKITLIATGFELKDIHSLDNPDFTLGAAKEASATISTENPEEQSAKYTNEIEDAYGPKPKEKEANIEVIGLGEWDTDENEDLSIPAYKRRKK